MSRRSTDPIWQLVRQERAALVADLRTVPDAAWDEPSLCAGWSVHDVVAHLVTNALTTPANLVAAMAWARFDFDRQNADGVAAGRGTTPAQTLARLEAVVSRTTGPPTLLAPLASRLVEEVAHGEDIRRPLGIAHDYAPDAVRLAVEYQARTSERIGGAKERVSGVRLQADDQELTVGDGPVVRGPALGLAMLVTGRPPREGALSGPGLALLDR